MEPGFAVPGLEDFDYSTEAISHTRNLTFLKKYIRGADFDLEAIWEEHCYFEFEDRSVAKTMGTMVQEPYVNHIPTVSVPKALPAKMKIHSHSQMTGGIGRKLLTSFYRDHFIFSNPPDVENELVSRTIGIDRVCDEFIMNFTHTCEVDWL
jgi:carboxymethylenebutenolidase